MLLGATSGIDWLTGISTAVLAVAAIAALVVSVGAFGKQSQQLRDLEEDRVRDQAERKRIEERQNRLDEERAWLARSEQARRVGCYTTGGGLDPVVLVLINDSGLRIARVEALATSGTYRLPLCGHQGATLILDPHSVVRLPPAPTPVYNVPWHTEMAFDDDNGVRWHKYGAEPLQEVPRDFSLFSSS